MGLYVWDDRYFGDVKSPHPAREPAGGCPCGRGQHVLQKPPPARSDDERVPVSSSGDGSPGGVGELPEISGRERPGDSELVAPEEPALVERE